MGKVLLVTWVLVGFFSGLAQAQLVPNPAILQRLRDLPAPTLSLLRKQAGDWVALWPEIKAGRIPVTDPRFSEMLTALGASLYDARELEGVIRIIVAEAREQGKLPASITPEAQEGMIRQMNEAIGAELSARGKTAAAQAAGVRYVPWDVLTSNVETSVGGMLVRASHGAPLPRRALLDSRLQRQAEATLGVRFLSGNRVSILPDGASAWAARRKLRAEEATNRNPYFILSWSIQNDRAGRQTLEDVRALRARGKPVWIIVDGQTADRPGYGEIPDAAERAGAHVLRLKRDHPAYFGIGTHGKFEGTMERIRGGSMNHADVYAHTGLPGTPRWRDQEVAIDGPTARVAIEYFASLWNRFRVQQKKTPLPELRLPERSPEFLRAMAESQASENPEGRVAFLWHDPEDGMNRILQMNLLAWATLGGSADELLAFNAYWIWNSATWRAINLARQRGVQVRLLSNGQKSVDEPIVSYPIVKSMVDAMRAGIPSYLWEGDTYHAKGYVIPGYLGNVQSHNEHGRSIRWEHEIGFMILDPSAVRQQELVARGDFERASLIPAGAPAPQSPWGELILRLFYDQL